MNHDLLLASASPRRRELLGQLGLLFDVLPADIDETIRAGETAPDYVRRMAREKALRGAELWPRSPQGRVLGADTAVVVDGRVLGKPANATEARLMLASLSGRVHEVMSAVALVHRGQLAGHELNCSRVRFGPLDGADIEAYLATGESQDKAGAYAIQGLAAIFIAHLEGSYSGVMGLPLFETAALLNQSGLSVL